MFVVSSHSLHVWRCNSRASGLSCPADWLERVSALREARPRVGQSSLVSCPARELTIRVGRPPSPAARAPARAWPTPDEACPSSQRDRVQLSRIRRDRRLATVPGQISLRQIFVSKTTDQVVVDHAGSLHECVADSGSDELEAALCEVLAHCIGLLRASR